MITGAGRGIGKEIAKKFAREGHDLYLLIHKKKDVSQIAKIFRKKYNIKLKYKIIKTNRSGDHIWYISDISKFKKKHKKWKINKSLDQIIDEMVNY